MCGERALEEAVDLQDNVMMMKDKGSSFSQNGN